MRSVAGLEPVDTALHEEFLALVLQDEDLLRAEFEALVSAGQGTADRRDGPPAADRPSPSFPALVATAVATRRPAPRPGRDGWARGRSPPGCGPAA